MVTPSGGQQTAIRGRQQLLSKRHWRILAVCYIDPLGSVEPWLQITSHHLTPNQTPLAGYIIPEEAIACTMPVDTVNHKCTKFGKLILRNFIKIVDTIEVRFLSHNATNRLSAPPQTPLGDFTALPRPTSWILGCLYLREKRGGKRNERDWMGGERKEREVTLALPLHPRAIHSGWTT